MPLGDVCRILLVIWIGASASLAHAKEQSKAEVRANQAAIALTHAVRSGDAEQVAKALRVRRINLNWAEWNSPTPLWAAVDSGRADLVRMILAAKADPNQKGHVAGTYPLLTAVHKGDAEIVEILLAAGANPDRGVQGPTGFTSTLTAAISQDHPELFERLLKAGANVNGQGSEWTPLVQAAVDGRLAYAQRLIAGGANGRDSLALRYSVEKGHTEILRTLLDAGAAPDLPRINEQSLLRHAIEAGQTETARLLLDAGAKLDAQAALLSLARGGSPELVPLLLAAGVSVNAADAAGNTALMIATQGGSPTMVQALLAAGANVNARTDSGGTALLWAATQSNVQVMRLLLAANADPTVRSPNGATVLLLASRVRGIDNAALLALAKTLPQPPPRRSTSKDARIEPVTARESTNVFSANCQLVDRKEERCFLPFQKGAVMISNGAHTLQIFGQPDVELFTTTLDSMGFPYARSGFDAIDAGGVRFYCNDLGTLVEVRM